MFGELIGIQKFGCTSGGLNVLNDTENKFLMALPSFISSAITNSDVFVQTREELESAKLVTER